MNNFLGMNRGLLDHWVYSDIYTWRVWSHILFMAQYSTTPNQWFHNGYWITQEYGEFVYGRDAWSLRLQVPEQRLRTIMKKFEKEGMITQTGKNTPKCSVYAVTNYAKFNQQSNQQEGLQPQAFEADTNQQDNQRLTSSQPAANHNKDSKERKKEKNEQDISFAGQVVTYLNDKSGKGFDPKTKAIVSIINARKEEGATIDDFKLVIDYKSALWKNDSYWKTYLRPSTLFAPSHFNEYLAEAKSDITFRAPQLPAKKAFHYESEE